MLQKLLKYLQETLAVCENAQLCRIRFSSIPSNRRRLSHRKTAQRVLFRRMLIFNILLDFNVFPNHKAMMRWWKNSGYNFRMNRRTGQVVFSPWCVIIPLLTSKFTLVQIRLFHSLLVFVHKIRKLQLDYKQLIRPFVNPDAPRLELVVSERFTWIFADNIFFKGRFKWRSSPLMVAMLTGLPDAIQRMFKASMVSVAYIQMRDSIYKWCYKVGMRHPVLAHTDPEALQEILNSIPGINPLQSQSRFAKLKMSPSKMIDLERQNYLKTIRLLFKLIQGKVVTWRITFTKRLFINISARLDYFIIIFNFDSKVIFKRTFKSLPFPKANLAWEDQNLYSDILFQKALPIGTYDLKHFWTINNLKFLRGNLRILRLLFKGG